MLEFVLLKKDPGMLTWQALRLALDYSRFTNARLYNLLKYALEAMKTQRSKLLYIAEEENYTKLC